ncbi:MAG: LPS export ABC transporter periplasmic protein LptC [Alloprevotella sp.]
MRTLFLPLVILIASSLLAGCGSEAPPMGKAVQNRDSLPVMTTFGVTKLISDSGIMRYKIVAEEWRVYDKTKPPRWEFPQGLFLVRFDDMFKINMEVCADTATLYDQNLWKLRGHIVLNDLEAKTTVHTNELYWNMRTGELRSDVYTRLEQPDQKIEGNWFRATLQNKRLTRYHVKQTSGFMPANNYGETAAPAAPTDTAKKDTVPPREPTTPHARRN